MRLPLKIAALAVVAALIAVAAANPPAALLPVRRGNAADFWSVAMTGRKGPPALSTCYCSAAPLGGWYLYAATHFHGADVFRVPAAEVWATCPRGPDEFGAALPGVGDWAPDAFRAWEKADPERENPGLLLLFLREAREGRERKIEPEIRAYSLAKDLYLGVAWERMQVYPLVRLGEWAYLTGVLLFAAWPWLRGGGRWSWSIHLGLLPPLLLLPYHLGYCAFMYTSLGPGGGAAYPWVLWASWHLPWTDLDSAIVSWIPQILAPLTGGDPQAMSMSGGRRAGLLAGVILGLLLGAAAFALMTPARKPDGGGDAR